MRDLVRSTSTIVLPIAIAIAAISAKALRFDTAGIADAIPAALQELPDRDEVTADVLAFYEHGHRAQPVWIVDRRGEAARRALDAIDDVSVHGLDPAEYGVEAMRTDLMRLLDDSDASPEATSQRAALDVRITASLLQAGRHVALGRTTPDVIDRRWTARRTPPDFAGSLARLAETADVDTWLEAVQPRHAEYANLQAILADARSREEHDQIRQIELNLDRWRWMPDDLGSKHFLVNIPGYILMAREDSRSVKDMRVVVGKRGLETPVFSGEMATVVFSPYWHVPDSIVEGETAPAAARDSEYLARNAIDVMRVTKSGTERVDPSRIDWEDTESLRGLAFRQRPGPRNALGHVKFLFPNPYNVYLHDTPADSLFARATRALSHGCVRVEEPEALAQYVLRDHAGWDAERIKKAMYSGVEQAVKLPSPIPVHIVYFTVWVDDDGTPHFYDDVYGHDTKQLRALAPTN